MQQKTQHNKYQERKTQNNNTKHIKQTKKKAAETKTKTEITTQKYNTIST